MKKQVFVVSLVFTTLLLISQNAFSGSALEQAFAEFRGAENLTFDAERGKKIWHQDGLTVDGKLRNCTTCHGKDLTQKGKHAKTGKVIDPLAPSANSERFTELKKIHKWFKRNCKWVLDRECTSQEKGDLLEYLSKL